MANTLNLGTDGNWGVKKDSLLGYNSENGNFKPLPFDFTRASSATVVNKAGLIETVGSGEPRIDFSNDAKGALLLEPTRSNLLSYSEDFSQSYWLKTSGVGLVGGQLSPDGTNNAYKFTANSNNSVMYKQFLGSINTNYNNSIYAKRVVGNGDVVLKSVQYNDLVIPLTTEWQRFNISDLSTSSTLTFQIGLATLGDEILIYGAQLEQGSYATSYIPTQGSAVTRVAEGSFITNLDTKNIITNSGSWTAFFELELLGNESPVDKIQLSDNSNVPRVYLYGADAGVSGTGWSGGAVLSMNTNNKIIYRGNSTQNISFFENGVNEATLSSASAPITFNRLNLYGANGAFKIKQIQLFKTSLSDAECITLTSL